MSISTGLNKFFSSFKLFKSYALLIVKLREREGQGVNLGRSLKGHLKIVDGGWWMVDILSLELTLKLDLVHLFWTILFLLNLYEPATTF